MNNFFNNALTTYFLKIATRHHLQGVQNCFNLIHFPNGTTWPFLVVLLLFSLFSLSFSLAKISIDQKLKILKLQIMN